MRYYRNGGEWETLFQVRVGVLLLCSEMGINLKADKQNPQSAHTMYGWQREIVLSLTIKGPVRDGFISGLELKS